MEKQSGSKRSMWRRMLRGITKTCLFILMFLLIGGYINYLCTHSKLTRITTADNDTVFLHNDQLTTHLLNVLAQKEVLTEEDLCINYRAIMEHYVKTSNVKLTKEVSEMSVKELDDFFLKNKSKIRYFGPNPKDTSYTPQSIELDFVFLNKTKKDQFLPSSNLYKLLWKLEEECGNPKIRFRCEDYNFTPSKIYKKIPHYNPLTNTLYIEIGHLIGAEESFFGEISHAKQFNDNQIATYCIAGRDFASIILKSGFNSDSIAKGYNKLYYVPGNFEDEAHKIIEPDLKKRYPLFTKKNGLKK